MPQAQIDAAAAYGIAVQELTEGRFALQAEAYRVIAESLDKAIELIQFIAAID